MTEMSGAVRIRIQMRNSNWNDFEVARQGKKEEGSKKRQNPPLGPLLPFLHPIQKPIIIKKKIELN